ncbi:glycoside hydrolase family 13 protein [Punctularia strigosozonata HHB-11173 SS5]|uniref:glycoside hydrolase family 13 protein n=1 Tax=Punctularia strigosozonata (strain HHB-11173) TaxID=741275 RepID=UPI00044179E7|nr:glycoside hydrolase family 13 protein [Punctularia strigosozonata HHB-11173 SS5]EIN07658.1 glycoside hydrolase family 13 protein [Punctularia strigosozonata HHB-11173 SS5]
MNALISTLLVASLQLSRVYAATAEQWRGRSIYQVITDRYALPAGADTTACDPGKQTWCGGTWNTIKDNLDYIQDAGFTAIWISPTSQNYEGPRTAYGDAYHGYWIADITQLNPRYGTSSDLLALSKAVHARGMYLMVDVVVNNVMSTTINVTDWSPYLFKDASYYHPYCPVDFSNLTSEQDCWLGDDKVPLPDVNTADPAVQEAYGDWVQGFVQQYQVDGLRIDAAKHVNMDFWPGFCGKAGVFCIGEVFDGDVPSAAAWQGPQAMDSILNYPTYTALVDAFAIPGPNNVSALVDVITQSKALFKDPGLLGNFLGNQDLPRWHNISVDPQTLYNAMTFNFMSDGIPIVYYGQEQSFSGIGDPWNREPLWTSGYAQSDAYKFIQSLNQFRNFLVNSSSSSDWLHQPLQLLTTTGQGLSFLKGDVVTVLTTVGSPPSNATTPVYTPFDHFTALTEVLTCQQFVVGSNGTVVVNYALGGRPTILVPTQTLKGSGICGATNASAGTPARPLSVASVAWSLALATAALALSAQW